jgi:eukaryotic-like serine/threonine-protein kinase
MNDEGSLIGTVLGPWRLEERIGQGGAGEVYRAVRADGEYAQTVAVKTMRAGVGDDAESQRFLEEIETLAFLNHPSIAKLLDSGWIEPRRPYLVMEYVNGRPIDIYANERGLGVRERLVLFLRVCDAVAYAHRNLVVHLDLKPANILVSADGVPKLLDFGIAQRIRAHAVDGPRLSLPRDFFSRSYASPEQVTPGSPITTAADVYSLGVILYELLAGRPPLALDADSEEEALRRIREDLPAKPSRSVESARTVRAPNGKEYSLSAERSAAMRGASPRQLRKLLNGKLDNILLVALRKQEERRYPSVEEFARDVQLYLEGKRVHARPQMPGYSAVHVVRHQPLWIVAILALGTTLATNLSAPAVGERERLLASEHRLLLGRELAPALRRFQQDVIPHAAALPRGRQAVAALSRLVDTLEQTSGSR